MNTRKTFITLGLLLAFVIILPVARADESNQATEFTFSQPVQIPGRVLPAGTYWFVLVDNPASRNIVRVFNSDRSMVYATIFTVSIESPKTTDNAAITFAEREPMHPETILSWFYPGRTSGHQFVYSTMEEQELSQVKHHTVVARVENKHQAAGAAD